MRLIVLFFLSWGVFAQEDTAAQRKGALTALYNQVYGDSLNGDNTDWESSEAFDEFVQKLATCTYGEQHEASTVVDALERAECSAVLQEAFDNGVANTDVENAIEQASTSEAAQVTVEKP